ncbi:MAG TPA: potassium transporter Kup [Thermoanaerobaculia bacterium]|jgi:KUP system potassium uptake protein|nr:potassium transporter Kup [Thermoanaerobaculia bacterium]
MDVGATTLDLEGHAGERHSARLAILSLTALGIVYGDIGTSPLYALRECFFGPHAVPVSRDNVLGVLSLIVWTLVIVVTLKYHVYVLRADNEGEGGILALMALATRKMRKRSWLLIGLGLFGAALLYGDGMITPAISVLSAVEGLKIVAPQLERYVVPATIVILVLLFLFQRRGTAGVGLVFGPVILIWFGTLAVLGVLGIVREPAVLAAFNPLYAYRFFVHNGLSGYLVLGAVFLVSTGGEALYADLGHFGEAPIQIDWFSVVAPSLLLNYFGQGALLLRDPGAADNPFYRLAPEWALYPMLILATMATVIASQAVISGVFSLTRQAVQLGYAPRMEIVHTSERQIGQIYVPLANWGLMIATIALVVGFRTSSNLAAAYGVAVTTTMIITTLLAFVVARRVWGWKLWAAAGVTAVFLTVDVAFFGANIVKVAQGGWFPLVVAAGTFVIFTSWRRGRSSLATRQAEVSLAPQLVIDDVVAGGIPRTPGTAVFLTGQATGTPPALLHNLKHNRVVHERNLFLTVRNEEVPHVPEAERLSVEDLGQGFQRVIIRYGFMEDADIPPVLRGIGVEPDRTTFFLSRSTVLSRRKGPVGRILDRLFIFMGRNAQVPTQFFRLPPNRVIEIGMQVEI